MTLSFVLYFAVLLQPQYQSKFYMYVITHCEEVWSIFLYCCLLYFSYTRGVVRQL